MQAKKELGILIEKYLNGNASKEEARRLQRWMHELDFGDADLLDQRLGSELKNRIDLITGQAEQPPVRKLWRSWYSVAASILILISVAVYFIAERTGSSVNEKQVAKTLTRIPGQIVNRHTNTNQKEEILTLSDGTNVTLLKGSTLIWKEAFDDSSRTVELHGTGYFEVARMPEKPFSVVSDDFITTAIGTSFWVRQNDQTGYPEVNLITGKVMVARQGLNTNTVLAYLNPGETLRFRKSGEFAVTKPALKKAAAPVNLPQIKGVLEFNNTPLDQVLTQLSAYYHVDIRFSPEEMKGMSFYGTYNKEYKIEEILQTIGLANDLQIEQPQAGGPFIIKK